MIELRSLTKRYGKVTAVNDLSLVVERGTFFGLLGPNGAGKTTLIRMLSTLTPPTSGQILIHGVTMGREQSAIKRQIGIVSQHINMERELTLYQNLLLHAKLFQLNKQEASKQIETWLDFADLQERKNDRISVLSGGMKRKAMIIRAMLHQPQILLLDEPTAGLDAFSRHQLWDLLRLLHKQGMTIFLTTHYIEEAEALCDCVGLLDQGILIEVDTPQNLIEQAGAWVLETYDPETGKTQTLLYTSREDAMAQAKDIHTDVHVRAANLEDVFMKLTNRKVTSS